MLIRFIMQENGVSLKAFPSNHTFHAKSKACDFKRLSAKELCFFSRKLRTKGRKPFKSASEISERHKILVSVFLALL